MHVNMIINLYLANFGALILSLSSLFLQTIRLVINFIALYINCPLDIIKKILGT